MLTCTFKLYERVSRELIKLEEPLCLSPADFLSVELDLARYVLRLKGKHWAPFTSSPPDLILNLLTAAQHLGKIKAGSGGEQRKMYVIKVFTNISRFGLCPCLPEKIARLGPGQILQLWTGELLMVMDSGQLQYIPGGWTPGRDHTPAQTSRWWERD